MLAGSRASTKPAGEGLTAGASALGAALAAGGFGPAFGAGAAPVSRMATAIRAAVFQSMPRLAEAAGPREAGLPFHGPVSVA
jgi:hypothetical protein